MEDQIKKLIKSASEAVKPDDAMKFAQAALNAANAYSALKNNLNKR
jgi:hypothetical protein